MMHIETLRKFSDRFLMDRSTQWQGGTIPGAIVVTWQNWRFPAPVIGLKGITY